MGEVKIVGVDNRPIIYGLLPVVLRAGNTLSDNGHAIYIGGLDLDVSVSVVTKDRKTYILTDVNERAFRSVMEVKQGGFTNLNKSNAMTIRTSPEESQGVSLSVRGFLRVGGRLIGIRSDGREEQLGEIKSIRLL